MKFPLSFLSGLVLYGFVATALMPFSPVSAQGTQADYDRANHLDRLLGGKVVHGAVHPN